MAEQYDVIEAGSPQELVEKVKEASAAGWRVSGGVATVSEESRKVIFPFLTRRDRRNKYLQAVTKVVQVPQQPNNQRKMPAVHRRFTDALRR